MVARLEGRRRTSLVFEPAEGDAHEAADTVSVILKGILEDYRWTPAISAPLAFPSIVPLGTKVFMDFDFVDEEDALERAALSLANTLTREGWTGQVLPGRPVPPSRRIPLDRVNAVAPEVEAAWVADPHGVQLLTDAHLHGISLGSSWTVEPVTTGKYLVKARALGQWFDLGRPLDSTLAQAREPVQQHPANNRHRPQRV
jgi:hypothetical protein